MPVTLTVNGRTTSAPPGPTLFECAETLGIRVPTSCQKNGKCKECVVEVAEGMPLLSPPTASESHLKPPFRLSCQTSVASDTGTIRCHTMRRGQMRIERHALHMPASPSALPLDPAVTRDGDRILIGGEEIARSASPIHGLAMDLGTTTIVLRLFNLESGEQIADASFENPQRFGGSDVMSRIRYDTEHPGKLLRRTVAGYLTHAIEDFPVDPRDDLRDGRRRQLDDAGFVLQAERVLDRADPVSVDHRARDGRGKARIDEPERDRPPVSAAHSSQGTRLRAADCQRSRWSGRRRVHACREHRARGSARRDHGHRHQHRAHRREPASNPRGVLSGGAGIRGGRDLVRHARARGRDRGRRARR